MSVNPVVFGFCKRQVVRLHSYPTLSFSVSFSELIPLSPGGGGTSNRPHFSRGPATLPWGCSSAGRAPDLHSGGRRFDPDQLHQRLSRFSAESGPVAQLVRAHP